MARSNKKKPRRRSTSTLREHRQVGKVLSPPLMTIKNMQSIPWLRDTFPDLIWLATLITEHGTEGMLLAGRLLDRVNEVLNDGDASTDQSAWQPLTGQLSAFERVPAEKRKEILDALKADGLFERAVPWIFARALMKYTGVPGRWLFNGWEGNEQIVAADQPERLLAEVVGDHIHGQTRSATKAKAMMLRGWIMARMLELPSEIGEEWLDVLPRYPDRITEEERQRIEPDIRATFLAFADDFRVGDDGVEPASITWAKNFWRSNWRLYKCVLPKEDNDAESPAPDSRGAIREVRDRWKQRLDELVERLLSVARGTDPDLYAPDRHEVLTGISYRMLRALAILIDYPSLWTMEHGASYIRALVEARIVLKWLVFKDELNLYERFKSYGRGRLKLLKLHLEEYRDGLDESTVDLDAQIAYLEALVDQDVWEEFQDISIEGSFAGIDTRRMAEQVDMLTEYRFLFAPASASVHGEWGALDQYTLTMCRNPLHRGHRIPRDELRIVLGPELVETTLSLASELVNDYVSSLSSSGQVGPVVLP